MPRLKNRVPSYRLHKQSGQAIVTLSGRDFLLGLYDSKDSREKYDRLIAEWVGGGRQPLSDDDTGLTIGEVIATYWERHVRPRFEPLKVSTAQSDVIRAALRPLMALYHGELASRFSALNLRVVRDSMVEEGLARSTINRRVKYIVAAFKWLASNDLVPVEVWHKLLTIDALRKGQTTAREPERVQPVDDAHVEAVLPHLPEVVADMVRLQRLTGMRPGEVCVMRPCDIDRSGDVWTYQPASHKTAYLGRERTIFIGPHGQAILLRYLARDSEAFCFQPRDSEAKRLAARHANRKTPISCGNKPGSNRKRRPRRTPTDRYTTLSYARAIGRGCDKCFPPPLDLQRRKGETGGAWIKRLCPVARVALQKHYAAHRFSPNQLRHSAATEIRKAFGLEAAQVVLGHSTATITGEIYAERDAAKAMEVARKIG